LAEQILKKLKKHLQAKIEWTKEELKRHSEELKAVNKALEEL
jgi:hypothetical protein